MTLRSDFGSDLDLPDSIRGHSPVPYAWFIYIMENKFQFL